MWLLCPSILPVLAECLCGENVFIDLNKFHSFSCNSVCVCVCVCTEMRGICLCGVLKTPVTCSKGTTHSVCVCVCVCCVCCVRCVCVCVHVCVCACVLLLLLYFSVASFSQTHSLLEIYDTEKLYDLPTSQTPDTLTVADPGFLGLGTHPRGEALIYYYRLQ